MVKHYRRLDNGTYVEEPIEEAVRRLGRAKTKPKPTPQWWLINAKFATRCSLCREYVFEGQVVAYNHEWRQIACEPCWEREGLNPMASRKLKRPTGAER